MGGLIESHICALRKSETSGPNLSYAAECRPQEAYLRLDVTCGSRRCKRGCPLPGSGAILRDKGSSHYAIPDSRFLLEYLEVLELPEFQDFILLSSVLQNAVPAGGPRLT